jgi:hypothetical protein
MFGRYNMNCIDCGIKLSKQKYTRCHSCNGKNSRSTKLITRICINCHKEFKTWPCYVKLGRAFHCSKKCRNKTYWVNNNNFKLAWLKYVTEQKGENNCNWKGGITPLNQSIRTSAEYGRWRKMVFERDNFTCQLCGQIGGYLEADHIKSFSRYPEFRFCESNGRTLCKECHKKTDNYGNRYSI